MSLRKIHKCREWRSLRSKLQCSMINVQLWFYKTCFPLIPACPPRWAKAGTFLCCLPVFSSPLGDNPFFLAFSKCWDEGTHRCVPYGCCLPRHKHCVSTGYPALVVIPSLTGYPLPLAYGMFRVKYLVN